MSVENKKFFINDSIIFYIVTSLYWFGLYTYGSVLSNHAASMGANAVMIGVISGSYGLAQMLLRLPIGIFSDRLKNRKLFIGLGLLFTCISSIGLGFSKTPESLLVFRSVSGLAAAMFVVFPGYIIDVKNGMDNHKIMGTLSAVNKTGRMVGIFIGGIVAQLIGVEWVFFMGAIALGFGIVIWFKLPKDTYHVENEKHSIKELLSVIKSKDLYVSSIIVALFQFCVFATIYTFNPIIAKSLSISDSGIGILTSVFTLMGVISAILSGTFFKNYIGAKKTVIISFIFAGILLAFFPYLQNIVLIFIFQIVIGFFMGVIFPLMMAQALKSTPADKKGTAMGFFQAIYGIGMVSGPFVVGLITRYFNIETGYLIVLGICVIASFVTYMFGKDDRLKGLKKY